MGFLKTWALKYTFRFLSPSHAWPGHFEDASSSGLLIDGHQEAVPRITSDEALGKVCSKCSLKGLEWAWGDGSVGKWLLCKHGEDPSSNP